MVKRKNRTASRRSRKAIKTRKNRSKSRHKGGRGAAKSAPKIIANSVFALALKPKGWAELHDGLTDDEKDPSEIALYRDLVCAYNQGADLVGKPDIQFDRSKAQSAQSIAELLNLFRKNICPEGFEVNIDSHFNKKKKREGFHFSMYKHCKFPGDYWHFFDIKKLVNDLYVRNRRLHDFFIVFLRSFISNCAIPTWFDWPMMDAEWELSSYTDQLRKYINDESIPEEAYQRTGYTPQQMKERLVAIEKTMKEYANGQANEYMIKIKEAKPRTPESLLKSLKGFPPQTKLVQFMKNTCELMKLKVGVVDFCYHESEGEDDGALAFSQQVTIVWDWSDHLSGTYGNAIEAIASSAGTYVPTLCARILPSSTGGLKMENLEHCLTFPMLLSKVHAEFQSITERYTDYKKSRNLL